MATYEINGREVSKEEYDRATAGIPNKYKSKAKPVDDVTADKSTTSNSPSSTLVALKGVTENGMDNIDLPVCLWNLYMMGEDVFLKNSDLNNIKLGSGAGSKVLIAASGRTDEFTISNVSIDSKIGFLPGVNTDVTFDITSPYSSDLIDKMLTSAAFLGINNYSKAPLMMELSVKGRDPKTGLAKHFATRSFAIFIKGIGFSVNEEGARYSVEASSVNDYPRGEVAENLNEQITLEGKDPGALLEDLKTKLLNREQKTITVRKDVADQYEFIFADSAAEIKTTEIKANEYEGPTRTAPKTSETENKTTATEKPNHTPSKTISVDYEKGTGITSIIENIMMNSPVLKKKVEEYEKKNKEFAEQIKKDGTGSSPQKVNIKQFYNFDTQIEYLSYDFLRRDYAKKYTYTIHMYETPFGYVAQTDISTDKKQNTNRINEIQEKIGIKKLYNYMYSGKNDQIIDLQYNFDNMYYVAIGAQSELIDSFKFEPGVRYDPTLRKKLDDAKIASNNLQLYHKSTKTDDANEKMRLQQQILKNDPDLRAKVNASEFDTSVTTQDLIAQKAEEYQATVLAGRRALQADQSSETTQQLKASGGATPTESSNALKDRDPTLAMKDYVNENKNRLNNSATEFNDGDYGVVQRTDGGSGTYSGNIANAASRGTVFMGDISRQMFNDYYRDKPLPPMFYETGKVTQTGIEGDTTPGGGLLAQYFNNAKNIGSTGDMMNVEMTIKGDLFYLPDLSRNSAKNPNVTVDKPVMIIVTSNQVSEYDRNGFMRINTKNALNGLYMVVAANHKWQDDGQYTITLDLRRELGTDLHGLSFKIADAYDFI